MKILKAKTLSGDPITIEFSDKGDLVPAHDQKVQRFECYVSHFKGPDWEEYAYVNKRAADDSGDALLFRMNADLFVLRERGVDTETIEICD
jgi:hypothetical protein